MDVGHFVRSASKAKKSVLEPMHLGTKVGE